MFTDIAKHNCKHEGKGDDTGHGRVSNGQLDQVPDQYISRYLAIP